MLDRITEALDFQSKALALRAERQKLIAGNIANADTPGYKAVDMSFADALRAAVGRVEDDAQNAAAGPATVPACTHVAHLGAAGGVAGAIATLYRQPSQPAIDNNTVDLDLERAQFADNAVRYEATLRFLNGQIRTLGQAITGSTS